VPAQSSTSLARASIAGLVRDAARLDRTQSDPVVSARNAIGVVAPLVVGALTGSASAGLAATIGALQTAFADRPGPYRLRMLRMLGTALAAALTSGLAVVASRSEVASVALLLVLGFVAGLLLAGGPSATQVGVAGVAAALIIGHLPNPASAAVHVGLLVLAGGAFQALLAVAAWPLRRHGPERRALAGLYRELAAAARSELGTTAGPPVGDTLTAVRAVLYGLGSDHGPSVEAYRVLLDEAERVRREVVVIGGLAERLADAGRSEAELVRRAARAAADVLDEVAAALQFGRPVREDVLAGARAEIRRAVEALTSEASAEPAYTARAAAGRLRALSGQLRAVVTSVATGASEGRTGDPHGAIQVRRVSLRDPIAIVRANLTWESAVFRHAVRLSVLVAASDLAVRLADFGRGYWVPLTVLVVLRPDFATTFQRAVMRVAGTIAGLLVATALVHWVPGGDWWRIALIAVFVFGMRFSGPGNLALTAACLSGLVVVLLEIQGVPAHAAVTSRALATLSGGALALAASLTLPAWERRFVTARLIGLLAAYLRYTEVVADPAAERSALQRARLACRLARSNAQASVDRARSEPVRGAAEVELGRAVLVHTHRFIHAMLVVDSVRVQARDAGGLPLWQRFATGAAGALDAARQALADDRPPDQRADLRALQEALAAALLADPDAVGGLEVATALIDAADRIANSLDTLLAELHRQLPLHAAE
jgi:uncharacterized membrane protein YccC